MCVDVIGGYADGAVARATSDQVLHAGVQGNVMGLAQRWVGMDGQLMTEGARGGQMVRVTSHRSVSSMTM